MFRAGVNLVASTVVRHVFNRYHVQLITSLIIQRKWANSEKLHHNFMICPSTGVYESRILSSVYIYLIQNSQAVKKVCGPQKGYGEKRCEIQGGGQEMAVMVG